METDDKKVRLLEAGREIFKEKGYKNTNISAITKKASMAVGSFYNYYQSKEEIFLDVFINENDKFRKTIMDKIDWNDDPLTIIKVLFTSIDSKERIENKVLMEWDNDYIGKILKEYYSSKEGMEKNIFNSYLIKNLKEKMIREGFNQKKIEMMIKVYNLIVLIDFKIHKEELKDKDEVITFLVENFIKGIFSKGKN